MAEIQWASDVSGDFTDASDWTGGDVPGSSDDAILDAAGGKAYTVTSSSGPTVGGIQIAANATLAVTGYNFAAANGTGGGANAGVIVVSNSATFTIGGTVVNVGVIKLIGADLTELNVASNGVTLAGGGSVTFQDAASGDYGALVGGVITNIDNKISGDMDWQLAGITNESAGIIDDSAQVDKYGGEISASTIVNSGLIESTGEKFLLGAQYFDNQGGTIFAASGSEVELFAGGVPTTLVGGTLDTAGTGVVYVSSPTGDEGQQKGTFTFDGMAQAIDNEGRVDVQQDNGLIVEGTIDNAGVISTDGVTQLSSLEIGAGNLVLTGDGSVVLGPGTASFLTAEAAGAMLTNVANTIAGAGVIGLDSANGAALIIDNEAAGVIDANDASHLLVDTGGETLTNAGLAESTGAAGLLVEDTTIVNSGLVQVTGTGGLTVETTVIDNAGGTILAANGSKVLLDGADIAGGTLVSKGTGVLKTTGGANVLDGTASTVTLTGVLALGDGTGLTIEGAIDNGKDLELSSTGDATTLTIGAAGATLTGSGQLSLSNKSENEITGASSAATLTNVANTISGAGSLGGGALTLVNEAKGVIEDQFATGLTIDTGTNTITNAGIIKAVDGGSVSIESAIENSGTLIVTNGTLGLEGTVDNTGQIDVRGGTTLSIAASGVTLSGGGDLALSNADNEVTGANSAAVLTNVANTISGAGTISAVLVNEAAGVIEGQFSTGLMINTGSSTETNAGLIEAIDDGSVSVQSALDNTGTVLVTNGTLTLAGAVTGDGVAQIKGGVLDAAGSFDENVAFTGGTGVLKLADSEGYASGQVSGFSHIGDTSLDLEDIAFTSGVTTATFSGTSTSGVLTVTNGSQAAEINLQGDYLGASFGVTSDGHGGALVTDPSDLWANPVSGAFTDASDWTGGVAPEASAAAILDAPGTTPYTITSSANQTVASVQSAAPATLEIAAGLFAATNSSGAGANAGTIAVGDGAIFVTGGTLDNTGVLFLDGTDKGADMEIPAAGLTLTGAGEVDLGDTLNAPFQPCPPLYSIDEIAGAAGSVLTNVDNTIVGAGCLGLGQIGMVNEAGGVIDASLPTDLLLQAAGTLMNSGLIESTGAGGLYLQEGSVIDNAMGGTISADGGVVYTEPDVAIIGGTLTSSGAGYFYVDFGDLTLDGSAAVTSDAVILATATTEITLEGGIDNEGQLIVGAGAASLGDATLSIAANGATLTGGGEVVLDGENADTPLTGADAGATLTNVDNTITGEGLVGAGALTLINKVAGVIDADYPMAVDTGAGSLSNAGLIEATGAGNLTIQSPLANTGQLFADGAPVIALAAVTGAGAATINNATMTFAAAFSQNVTFEGAYGELVLGDSQAYSGTITGFAINGSTSLDLEDIAFIGGSTTATYSGTATSGVLTVANGTQTAEINLTGDYLASTFTTSSDGHGGTTVVDPTGPAAVQRFIETAARMAPATAAIASPTGEARDAITPMLARPDAATP